MYKASLKGFKLLLTLGFLTVSQQAYSSIIASDLLKEYNVITLNDFIGGGSEVVGPVYTGGDFTGSTTVINSADSANGSLGGTLVIGGDLLASVTIENGDALVGGTINPNITINMNGGGSVTSGVPNIPVGDVSQALKNYSLQLSSAQTQSGLVVQNIDVSFFSNPNNANLLNNFSNGTYLFNVTGSVLSSTNGFNFNGDYGNVIFNFFEATEINITTAFAASILAPLADIRNVGGGINGTVVGNTLFNQSETRSRFDGELPPPPVSVSEPAGLILIISGLLVLLRTRRSA